MNHRIARTGTCKAILISALLIPASVFADFGTISGATPDASARWSASGGVTTFEFNQNLLDELGMDVSGPANPYRAEMPGELAFSIDHDAALEFWAPQGAWDGFIGGGLEHSGQLSVAWPEGRIDLDGFVLRPAGKAALELVGTDGNPLFRLDSVHFMLDPEIEQVTLRNMDMSLTPWLANRMGVADLAGMVIAVAYTHPELNIPFGAQTSQTDGSTCTTPNWHNGTDFVTDVELSNLGIVQQVARQAGVRVAIAPSATLRNVGTADVPWVWKFTTPQGGTYPPPYNRDQHPFLVWAMYRVVDDIPQQIGQSGAKHAFLTVNGVCSCGSGHVLWAGINSGNGQGCTDVYGVGNNNDREHLGIRSEVPAFTGAWEQCGSIFAPGATAPGPCTQTYFGAENTDPGFERRLVVEESALQTEDATYYFEGWYVIRDDVNIFNTMAHKGVDPSFVSSWSFPTTTAHTLGPAIDSWVPPDTMDADQAHTVEVTGDGHYSLAVKVTDLDGGMFRYVYALMNYDFDPKFNAFAIPMPSGVNVANIQYLDGDSNGANDWIASVSDGMLEWTAPDLASALEWGFMATFVFEADGPPSAGSVTLTEAGRLTEFNPMSLGPILGLEFKQGFEDQN